MSDLNQIHTALERLFNEEGQRIVFWNDPDREFLMTVPLLELDGVKPTAALATLPLSVVLLNISPSRPIFFS